MADLPEDTSPMVREIHRRMLAAGLNPTSLAKRAGVKGVLADAFSGKQKTIGSRFLPKIADALGCGVNELLNPRRPELDRQTGRDLDEGNDRKGAENAERRRALLAFWNVLSDDAQRRVFELVIEEVERLRRD